MGLTMYNKIEKYIKGDYYYICPKCGASFQPMENIAYMGECDNCDWKGVYRYLEYKSAKELVKEIVGDKTIKATVKSIKKYVPKIVID